MSQETNKLSGEAFEARLVMLRKKVAGLHRSLDGFDLAVDDIELVFDDLLARSPETPGRVLATQRRRLPPLDYSAEVSAVQLVDRPDGFAVAQINNTSIPLAPTVADLFRVLIDNSGFTNDHLVGWKTIADIQFALKQRTRRVLDARAIKELVFRLRNRLGDHKLSRSLVQNNRRLGYRFALWRRGETLTERDNH